MRSEPPDTGGELEQLTAFLDHQRETVLLKVEGLDAAQLARPLPPSSLTLAGLLNHLALVEDSWFRERFAGLPAQEIWSGVEVAGAEGLDQLGAGPRRDGTRWNLRWLLLHMIEETARHAGHADLLREAVDGRTGE